MELEPVIIKYVILVKNVYGTWSQHSGFSTQHKAEMFFKKLLKSAIDEGIVYLRLYSQVWGAHKITNIRKSEYDRIKRVWKETLYEKENTEGGK